MFNLHLLVYRSLLLIVLLSLFLITVSHAVTLKNKSTVFIATESTITQVHQSLKNNTSSCVLIIKAFLNRINSYDKTKKLNSIILINPNALKTAKVLDKKFKQTKMLRPLYCIPVILKDNFDTADMPTEAGSIALKGSLPPDDATIVKKLRSAGAIIIAKSNMSEWAFSAFHTISSTHGETRNAYDLNRVPAGSSGGSASAIAANFGIIGMGTDTGNSLRGPAAHLSLVGLRATIGLVSRDGIVPLLSNRDVAGPLTRTVKDAAITFTIIAGYDPADPATNSKNSKRQLDYSVFLKKTGLNGIRLGVLRELFDTDTADFDVIDLMDQAINDLKKAGAVIVDPFDINGFKQLVKQNSFCSRFRYDLNLYLTSLGENAPVKNLREIIEKKLFGEFSAVPMKWARSVTVVPEKQQPPCTSVQTDPARKKLLTAILKSLEKHNVDAIIYPTWSNPARELDDNETPHGNNSPVISPHTGQPSITVPMGFTSDGLPAGLQFLVKHFEEGKLFQYAYAYEQQTLHRRAPTLFPELH